jgi:transposase InsO family protein
MFDISSVNALSQGGNKCWLLVMDDHTNYCWSFFLPHKDDLPQVMLQWLKQVTSQYKIKVKCSRCDNAGENKSFPSLLEKKWKHYTKFEYIAPNTPQQNSKIERKFATLYGKIRSVLNAAGFPAFLRSRLWSYVEPSVSLNWRILLLTHPL